MGDDLRESSAAMWSVGATVFVVTIASIVRAPLLPEIGAEFSMTASQLGVLSAVFAAGRLVADLPVGKLTDEVPTRRLLWTASLIVAGGNLLFAGAWTAAVTFVAAFLAGVGSSWTNTTGLAFFSSATHKRGTSVSFYATALLAGQALGPAFGGIVDALSDWRWAFVAAAVLAGVGIATARRAPKTRSRVTQRSADTEEAEVPLGTLAVIYALPAMQFAIGGALLQTLYPIVGSQELGLSAGAIGLALALGGAARVVGALGAGQISDRVGRRWALLPGLALQTVGITIAALDPTVSTWLLAIVLSSLGAVGVTVGATVLGDVSGGGGFGKRLGRFRFAGDLGFVLGPLVAGFVYEASGRATAMLLLAAATAGVAIAAGLRIPETLSRA